MENIFHERKMIDELQQIFCLLLPTATDFMQATLKFRKKTQKGGRENTFPVNPRHRLLGIEAYGPFFPLSYVCG